MSLQCIVVLSLQCAALTVQCVHSVCVSKEAESSTPVVALLLVTVYITDVTVCCTVVTVCAQRVCVKGSREQYPGGGLAARYSIYH